ncbi:alpha/beta fold hydrolase [Streptosporangium lutulentum]|uniref:Pimeloyl-ACP methyl ester carboxylesterase n=1 Tax=Streptosporangium lutulentum TaxID=1461250 RepID=A0ABT9QAW0_9ACTN|nr:alpha/beta hydrolase [Streptosporangium lutulentum]MDP9843910.1 pimeloyl-ACP methyl ester carboxylesterase [Streptosporangium lutulentum]
MPFFDTADGTRLAYEDYGTGEPIVFVASWSLASDMWEYQVPFFVEQGYRCVLLDRRGHGGSDRPGSGYDFDTLADDIAGLIEYLDLRGVTLVGHSAGGAEVARYLARHGEDRVARVAFVSAMLPFVMRTEDNPEGLPIELSEAAVKQFRTDRPKWFADRAQGFYATHLGNDVSPALIEQGVRRCLETAPMAGIELWRATARADHREGLRRITVPALVVHGAADQSALIDVTGRRTAKLIPGCVYKEYPMAGHGLFATHIDQLNGDLIEFVKG